MVEAFYGKKLPATAYVAQPPCDGSRLSIEAWGIGGDGRSQVEIERIDEAMVVARHDGMPLGLSCGYPLRDGGRPSL